MDSEVLGTSRSTEVEAPPRLRLSTQGLRERDRFEIFRENFRQYLFQVDVTNRAEGIFDGSIELLKAGSIGVSKVAAPASVYARTRRHGTPASGTDKSPAAPGAVPGPGAINTIHPIPSPPPAPVTGSGKGIVTVSDGKGNSIIIPDHGTGVTVTSGGPGHVTISNGVESRTVSGIALTISGANAVAVDKSLGTGPRKADGSVVVLSPNGTVTGTGPGDGFGLGGFEADENGPK